MASKSGFKLSIVDQLGKLTGHAGDNWNKEFSDDVAVFAQAMTMVVYAARGPEWDGADWENWSGRQNDLVRAIGTNLALYELSKAQWDSMWQLIPIARTWNLEIAEMLELLRERFGSESQRVWRPRRNPVRMAPPLNQSEAVRLLLEV